MLPFARLVSYGNEVPKPPSVKKIVGDPLGITVLYSDGDMFMRGGGSSYKMGNSSTTAVLNSWVKCQKKVIDVWACTYCTIILADDGKLYHAGAKSVFGTSGTNPVFTDVSSTFTSLNMSAIKDIQFTLSTSTDISALILMQDGALYGIGDNPDFWSGKRLSPVLMTTGVEQIFGSALQNSFHYIKSGVYYRAGENNFYQLGTGNVGSVVNYPSLTLSGTVLSVQSINNVTKLLVLEGSVYKLYTAGNNANLSIGNTAVTSFENSTFQVTSVLPGLTANSFQNISSVSYLCALRNSDGLICTNGGGNSTTGGGLGRDISSNLNYQRGNYFPVQFDDITINGADVDKFGMIGNGNTSVLSIGGDLYWCGSISYFKEQGVGTSGTQTKFRKCIPFK